MGKQMGQTARVVGQQALRLRLPKKRESGTIKLMLALQCTMPASSYPLGEADRGIQDFTEI